MDTAIPGLSTTIPFDALDDVVGVPTLTKVAGDGGFDPDEPQGIALGPLTAMPRSIVVGRFLPDLLHTQFVLVTTDFEEIACDGSGFAAAGTARAAVRFVPRRASLLRSEVVPDEEGGERIELVYGTTENNFENLPPI